MTSSFKIINQTKGTIISFGFAVSFNNRGKLHCQRQTAAFGQQLGELSLLLTSFWSWGLQNAACLARLQANRAANAHEASTSPAVAGARSGCRGAAGEAHRLQSSTRTQLSQ